MSRPDPLDALFLARRTEATDELPNGLPYRLLVPTGPPPPEGFPLTLLLHGAGERGDDNRAQLRHGAAALADAQDRFPSVVVVPQCPEGQRWVEVDWGAASHRQPPRPSAPLGAVLALLAALERELPVDPRRRYITGLSMGGFGTWDAITREPTRFAAAVPICGGGDVATAARVAALPIWAFHGSLDEVVLPRRSRDMIRALHDAGGAPRYSEYADVAHDAWERAYREPALLPWLFAQRR